MGAELDEVARGTELPGGAVHAARRFQSAATSR